MADLVSLRDCPPGLFRFGETIGFKTEYLGMQTVGPIDIPGDQVRWVVGDHSDVYVVETGESFWAGAANRAARDAMLVEPIDFDPACLASVSSASAETVDYRALLIQAGRNAGAFIDDRASDAFLKFIPEEVRLKIERLAASPEPVPATNQAREVERKDVPTVTSHDAYRLRKVAEADCGCRIPAPFDEVADHLAALSFDEGVKRCLATQPATSQEGEGKLDWRKIAKAAGEHGVRYRTNAALERFLSEIAATPTPPTLSEDLRALQGAVANLLPMGNDSLPGDRVIPIYVRMDELRALHTLAQVKAS